MVAGIAIGVVAVARWIGVNAVVAVLLPIGAATNAELVVELVEVPRTYAGSFHHSASYGTVSDMGARR